MTVLLLALAAMVAAFADPDTLRRGAGRLHWKLTIRPRGQYPSIHYAYEDKRPAVPDVHAYTLEERRHGAWVVVDERRPR